MKVFKATIVGFLLVFSLALAGCSTDDGPAGPDNPQVSAQGDNPYKPVIQEYLNQATNDFERETLGRALATGTVAEADYQEAVNGLLQCLDGKGFPTEAVPDPITGVVQYRTPGSSEGDGFEAAFEECSIGTTYLVGSLYDQMATNPNNGDFIEMIAQCLVRKGVYPEGFTGEDYLEIAQSAGTLPADDPFFSAESAACESNPSGP